MQKISIRYEIYPSYRWQDDLTNKSVYKSQPKILKSRKRRHWISYRKRAKVPLS